MLVCLLICTCVRNLPKKLKSAIVRKVYVLPPAYLPTYGISHTALPQHIEVKEEDKEILNKFNKNVQKFARSVQKNVENLTKTKSSQFVHNFSTRLTISLPQFAQK